MNHAAATVILVVCLAVAAALFFVWGIGRAVDHDAHCAQISGQCETP